MSILYKCETCGYETNMTYNFNRHKNKKIPCKKPIAKVNEIILYKPVKKYIQKNVLIIDKEAGVKIVMVVPSVSIIE